MADWTQIADATFDPDRPVLGSTHLAIVRNFEALAEGAAGAPRLYLRALEQLEGGTQIRTRNDAGATAEDGETSVALSWGFLQSGTIRVSLQKVGNVGFAQVIRERNLSSDLVFSEDSSGTYTVDVDVLPGDGLIVQAVAPLVGTTSVTNVRLQTNGQDLWPGVAVPLEGYRSAT